MSARGNVEFEGMEQILANLTRLGEGAVSLLELALEAGMEPIIEDANQRAPTPAVKSKITVKNGTVEAKIGFDKEHWYYQFYETGATPHEISGPLMVFEGEVGKVITRHVENAGGLPADPILRPALDEKKDEALRRILDVLMRGAVGEAGT